MEKIRLLKKIKDCIPDSHAIIPESGGVVHAIMPRRVVHAIMRQRVVHAIIQTSCKSRGRTCKLHESRGVVHVIIS